MIVNLAEFSTYIFTADAMGDTSDLSNILFSTPSVGNYKQLTPTLIF